MHKTKTELIELIADLKTKKDFEKEIKYRYKIYDGLIDQDTIALLIVDELGRNKQSVTKIVDLAPDGDYTVLGKVQNISDSKTFKRKNGTIGKVINLEITDETGVAHPTPPARSYAAGRGTPCLADCAGTPARDQACS